MCGCVFSYCCPSSCPPVRPSTTFCYQARYKPSCSFLGQSVNQSIFLNKVLNTYTQYCVDVLFNTSVHPPVHLFVPSSLFVTRTPRARGSEYFMLGSFLFCLYFWEISKIKHLLLNYQYIQCANHLVLMSCVKSVESFIINVLKGPK